MQVNSVSLASNQSFRSGDLDAFINLDEVSLKRMAYADTMSHVNVKKHKRQKRLLNMALPLAGGISAAAVADKGMRLAAFGKGTATWGLFLLGVGAVFGIEKTLRNHSEKIDNFAEKHPFLTSATSILGALFVGIGAMEGGAALGKAIANTNLYQTGLNKAGKLVENAKNITFVKNITNKATGFLEKTPSAIKNLAKGVASWSPWMVIIGQLLHSANYANTINAKYSSNYNKLRNAQLELTQEYCRKLREDKEAVV